MARQWYIVYSSEKPDEQSLGFLCAYDEFIEIARIL